MAVAFFNTLSAIGLKAAAFVQSLFFFPAAIFRQTLALLSNNASKPPTLPCSNSNGSNNTSNTSSDLSSSSSSASSSSSFSSPAASSTSASLPSEIATPRIVDDTNIADLDDNNNMAGPTSSSAGGSATLKKKDSVSRIVPALARVAPVLNNKENAAFSKTPDINGDAQTQIVNDFSALSLKENGVATNSATTTQALSMSNGNIAAAGTSSVDTGISKDDVFTSTPSLKDSLSIIASIGSSLATQEVTRAPPVPFVSSISQTSKLKDTPTIKVGEETLEVLPIDETPEQAAERAMHSGFMREALDMARLALKTNETPVGCVLVYRGRVIARGMNATNVSRNGTRHAELMALCALLSYTPKADTEPPKPTMALMPLGDKTNQAQLPADESNAWGDVDPRDGHLYPYGQKLHPAPRVDPSVIHESILYVTVEPCVMCASLLRQFGIKKVYFGAVNDKFGGTGGVFRIHKNSPYSMASAPPSPVPQNGKGVARPVLERRPGSTGDLTEGQIPPQEMRNESGLIDPIDTSHLPGDGGNIERGYEAEGGWGRDEAVTLLRQFYVQENNRAPVPRKKEGRAARLAAMMERDGHASGSMIDGTILNEDNNGESSDAQSPTIENSADAEASGRTSRAEEVNGEE
ncbi:putative tRNA-specific adenosine deaminase [Podospora fimiseda]|uniref:tRNA-specific adenosine deaminase n=1 Tax=Podospora fimiseda TaxID=252190 RepID=A0AAN6YNL2_9PEZI|nr:putative tRNA-specific adenosine deaminase [Podospora fimiseda]